MGMFAEVKAFWNAQKVARMPPPFIPATPGAPPPIRSGIRVSEDYSRIKGLPLRQLPPVASAEQFEALLKRPGGEQTLKPIQRQALLEAGLQRGGFLPIRVGGGKTLISFLLPVVLGAQRPLLLLPASLIEKTARELRAASKHWLVCQNLRVASYQRLGRQQGGRVFEEYIPDLIIGDECQFLKNRKAAVTRRTERYIGQYAPMVVLMGGTAFGKAMRHHAHLLRWTHQKASPAPLKNDVIDEWCQIIDEVKDEATDRSSLVGVLSDLYPPTAVPGEDLVVSARSQYFGRIRATQGVVAHDVDAKDDYGGSLLIRRIGYEDRQNKATKDFLKQLWDKGLATDGWPLISAAEIWMHEREIALGLCYVWNPRPEEPWLEARKRWAKFAREAIADSTRTRAPLDSELDVVNAVDRGQLDDLGLLAQWRLWKPTFIPNSEPRWHDTAALDLCAEWLATDAKSNPGICWVEHVFFGEELSRRTGIPYFREKGRDPAGNFIEDAHGPIIASVASNHAGRNLQFKWHRNLIVAPFPDADRNEQLLGRTHRAFQAADSVDVDILDGCPANRDAVARALLSARQKLHAGERQKILLADLIGF